MTRPEDPWPESDEIDIIEDANGNPITVIQPRLMPIHSVRKPQDVDTGERL